MPRKSGFAQRIHVHSSASVGCLLIGERKLAHRMEGLGAFLAAPADAPQIVRKAIEMLTEKEA